MYRFLAPLIFLSAISLTGISQAQQVPANIAYPLDGWGYKISPDYPWLPASISVTCDDDDPHSVEWGNRVGGGAKNVLGAASFKGQISVQFLAEYNPGDWQVWVDSGCGNSEVTFEVEFVR